MVADSLEEAVADAFSAGLCIGGSVVFGSISYLLFTEQPFHNAIANYGAGALITPMAVGSLGLGCKKLFEAVEYPIHVIYDVIWEIQFNRWMRSVSKKSNNSLINY